MSQKYIPGDFLIFQIESGFGLLRLLDIEIVAEKRVWHLSAYREMFLEVDDADRAITSGATLHVSHDHLAITTRAFESTQTSRMGNRPLNDSELTGLLEWRKNPYREVSDRSVRLLLGLR